MEHLDVVAGLLVSPGVEIGAFRSPIPGISPVYVDRFIEYAHESTMAEYYGDSADLPFVDSSLNYVATSHVIEHVANPLGAFLEWYRVLRHNGIIYMVVPDRRRTFDRARPLATVEHMIQDYRRQVTQCDGTHIEDFAHNVDWKEFSPGTPETQVAEERESLLRSYQKQIASGAEINIHFHTFEPDTMAELVKRANEVLPLNGGSIELVRLEPDFPASQPNGFLVVAKISKPGNMPELNDPSGIFRADARKIEWEEDNFPEESYLRLHSDVAAAVADGRFKSGYAHYLAFGREERRRVK